MICPIGHSSSIAQYIDTLPFMSPTDTANLPSFACPPSSSSSSSSSPTTRPCDVQPLLWSHSTYPSQSFGYQSPVNATTQGHSVPEDLYSSDSNFNPKSYHANPKVYHHQLVVEQLQLSYHPPTLSPLSPPFSSSSATQPSTPPLSSSSPSTDPSSSSYQDYYINTAYSPPPSAAQNYGVLVPEDVPPSFDPDYRYYEPYHTLPTTTSESSLPENGVVDKETSGIAPALTMTDYRVKRKRGQDDDGDNDDYDDTLPSTSSKPPPGKRQPRSPDSRIRRSRKDKPRKPSNPGAKSVKLTTTKSDGRVRCETSICGSVCNKLYNISNLSRHEAIHLAEEAGIFVQSGNIDVMSLVFVPKQIIVTLKADKKAEVAEWCGCGFGSIPDNLWDDVCAALKDKKWNPKALVDEALIQYKAVAAFMAQWYAGERWTCACLPKSTTRTWFRKDEVGTNHINKCKQSEGGSFDKQKHFEVKCWRAPWLEGGPRPLGL